MKLRGARSSWSCPWTLTAGMARPAQHPELAARPLRRPSPHAQSAGRPWWPLWSARLLRSWAVAHTWQANYIIYFQGDAAQPLRQHSSNSHSKLDKDAS